MHLLTGTKMNISASELQRQLGHKNYNPIWAMLHKLRAAMATMDSRCKVSDMVEVDDGFFSTGIPEEDKGIPLKCGVGRLMKEHVHQAISPKQVGKVLSWVHLAISNAKRLLLDIYHDICPRYLQNYLNEFCWKFNRRFFGDAMFDRFMVAAVA